MVTKDKIGNSVVRSKHHKIVSANKVKTNTHTHTRAMIISQTLLPSLVCKYAPIKISGRPRRNLCTSKRPLQHTLRLYPPTTAVLSAARGQINALLKNYGMIIAMRTAHA